MQPLRDKCLHQVDRDAPNEEAVALAAGKAHGERPTRDRADRVPVAIWRRMIDTASKQMQRRSKQDEERLAILATKQWWPVVKERRVSSWQENGGSGCGSRCGCGRSCAVDHP